MAEHHTEPAAPSVSDRILNHLRAIGPALVLVVVVIGPGSIALSTIAGSTYGYSLLWVPVIATVFMMAYTLMAARIGLVTGKTLFGATREKFSPRMAFLGGAFGALTILAFQVGNSAAIGFASEALFGYNVRLSAAFFTLLAVGFVWLPDLYDKVEWVVRIFVGIMLVAFVGTILLVGFDVQAAATGLVPTAPEFDAIILSIGIASTTFSIAAAVYQSHLMHEKEWGVEKLADEGADSIIGIGLLGLMAVVIMLTSASVIFDGGGDPASSAEGMALQLEPLVGPAAFYLFTTGFFLATLASIPVNALIGGTLFVDGKGGDPSMEGRQVKVWTTVFMGIGLLPVLILQEDPIEILMIAQALAIIAFPLLAYLVLSISSDRDMMGEHANGRTLLAIGIVGYIAVIAFVLNNLYDIVQFII